MKPLHILGAACALLFCVAGCGTTGTVKKATRSATVNLAATEDSRGYVEFFTRETNAAVPVYRRDDKQRLQLVGVIGLKAGRRYRTTTAERDAPVAESLRVAVSPGDQTFMIQRNGKTVSVPVTENKVTPVEVDYVILEHGQLVDIYRVSADVREAIPPSALRQALAKHWDRP
jgi:hypothetical protein